jgi:nitrite reductase/ring-hydroxylating ferredoxin subunit
VTELRIEGAAALPLGEARAFHWEGDTRSGGGFLLHHASGLVAFRNACPHWGVDLDMGMGGFYDAAIDRVFCRTHGALFQLPSGLCDRGPCTGDSLDALPLRVDGADVVLTLPDE